MLINLNEVPFIYWSDRVKIEYLQRRIIVYSILYYNYNESPISDKQYDDLSRQLVSLQEAHKEAFNNSHYYYCMYDFDGTTGFDLPYRLNDQDKQIIDCIARNVLRLWKGEKKNDKA